ncbi:MAG: metal ABC transporter ATP-binding protein [Alphaproteobacteria bacterium]|nr:MAG: metal ABC transporter ATP-binding protein [Alphaproteobacteria bacterium]
MDATASGRREILIEGRGLGVRRDGRWLIEHVDISVSRGEIVTLIGPNGSGKTTLAKTLLGLIAADAGTIRRKEGLRVGYVPQHCRVDRTLPLTVRRLMTLTGRYPEPAIRQALSETGVAHLLDAQLHRLSGGEFQRCLLARAIIREPDLLVLDEPVQGVDFAGEIALYELIGRLRDRLNCGVLLISHDLHLVMAATDTVVCLNTHICCSGPARSVAADPEYRRLFGHRAAETLAVYKHHHDHSHAPDGSVVHHHPLERPEDAGDA